MTHGKLNGDDFFDRWHDEGDQAFGILQEGCEVPPSFEVFEHSLEQARKRSGVLIHVKNHARLIADTYQRVDS